MSETIELKTQSFVLELRTDTYTPVKISLVNPEMQEEYEDDQQSLTIAMIRELAMNLQASNQMIAEHDLDVEELEETIDTLTDENNELRRDNDMLRDELDNAE